MPPPPSESGISGPPSLNWGGKVAVETHFRWRLQVAIMLVTTIATLVVLFYAQQRLAVEAEVGMRHGFQRAFDAVHNVDELRNEMLLDRCEELVRKLNLDAGSVPNRPAQLYPDTHEVLHDIMGEEEGQSSEKADDSFHAEFYRFLDAEGRVLEPAPADGAGRLLPGEAAQLRLPGPWSDQPQLGSMIREQVDADGPYYDLIALPLRMAAGPGRATRLVLGFEPADRRVPESDPGTKHGIFLSGQLFIAGLPDAARREVAAEIGRRLSGGATPAQPRVCAIDGVPHLLLFQQLNPGSAYPPTYQVGLFPLTAVRARQWQRRWQVLGLGGLVLLTGLLASRLIAARFARTVETLVLAGAQDRDRRQHAETALQEVSAELQRAARFSADASHQLKTPVTVLRTGLEELLVREELPAAAKDEMEGLLNQTYRLTGLIEDLLLLARIEGGRLTLQPGRVDLVPLIGSALDDWSIRPHAHGLEIEKDLPEGLPVEGEQRYLELLVRNLLDNAGKYNRPGGRVRLRAGRRHGEVWLAVGNTTVRPIPPAAQGHIFDRFHRSEIGENIPGFGLGLNLAQELARLHHGDIRLLGSAEDWTEFELRLPAPPAPGPA
ncbi:MAG: sensor histidine kinase [Opitutales bacterium]